MCLVLLRYRAGVGQRRETHLAPVGLGGRVVALCGWPFEPDEVEYVAELCELPCVPCQLLSPEPDWQVLERVPYPPRLRLSMSGS